MPIKKKGLGKGLDSLIPDNKSMKSVTSEKTVESKEDAAAKSGSPLQLTVTRSRRYFPCFPFTSL